MIEQLFSESNLEEAQASFNIKHNSAGYDGVLLSDVFEYFDLNREEIISSILEHKYVCKKTMLSEMLNYKGKRRIIAKMCSIDRYISRLLEQVLAKKFDVLFSDYSYAYRKNYGVTKAVEQIKEYIKDNDFVCFVDIQDFFDEIDHELLLKEVKKYIKDEDIIYLITCFLKCEIEYDYISSIKNKGIIQGNSLSPLLSNIFLNSLDKHLENKDVSFVRFADNIYMFFKTKDRAYNYLNHMNQVLKTRYDLQINKGKSGIFPSHDIIYLGYRIEKNKNHYEIIKVKREKPQYYSSWYISPLRYSHHQYHIINDGILRKKDYHILFENDEQKVNLPIEVVDHINIHSQVVFTSSFFNLMNQKKLVVNLFDQQGNYIGQFIPNNQTKAVYTTLKQANIYQDKEHRLMIAKKMVNASIHDERSNMKYYHKKTKDKQLLQEIEKITQQLQLVNEAKTYEELLLIEARAKQIYYNSLQFFIKDEDFIFDKRTRQPPQDNINALISFGNTILYNLIANEIYKTSLDIRIGYLHASNARKQSLNLDLADIFKPIIIDRTIFTIIHKKIISNKHFEQKENGIYLNKEGKSIFIHQINKKLYQHINYNGISSTYYTIIRNNIYVLQQHINNNQKLKFYKYQ